jgi:NAD(P)-dependent dehydrogenase (short-subunit alcohol dehydrogenase family)
MSEAPLPSFTKKWHNTAYAAIDPTRPELSLKGKTIVITGGGRGIGAEIAYAYAQAGASVIGVTGRTEATLETLRKRVEGDFPATKVITAAADISDAVAVEAAFKKFNDAVSGKGIDILIQNAGLLPRGRKIAELDTPELLAAWWAGFQTNVLGLAVVAKTFFKYKSANDPKFINLGTAGTAFPPMATFSGYIASKFASAYVLQYFQAENPGLKVFK